MYNAPQSDGRSPRLLAAFRAVLPRSAKLKVAGTKGPDTELLVGFKRLRLRWVGRAGLREVQDVLDLRNRPDVIVGSEISLAARDVAAEAGLGWVDETGAAEVALENILTSSPRLKPGDSDVSPWLSLRKPIKQPPKP